VDEDLGVGAFVFVTYKFAYCQSMEWSY